jgi:hypothetical protein
VRALASTVAAPTSCALPMVIRCAGAVRGEGRSVAGSVVSFRAREGSLCVSRSRRPGGRLRLRVSVLTATARVSCGLCVESRGVSTVRVEGRSVVRPVVCLRVCGRPLLRASGSRRPDGRFRSRVGALSAISCREGDRAVSCRQNSYFCSRCFEISHLTKPSSRAGFLNRGS